MSGPDDTQTHYGHLLDHWQAAKEEARHILIDHARQGQTITYGELSASIQTVEIPYHSYAMSGLLRELHREEEAASRPGLATLVVRKSDGLPGPGYFKSLAEAGIPEADFRAYWQTKFEAVCEYWQATDDSAGGVD